MKKQVVAVAAMAMCFVVGANVRPCSGEWGYDTCDIQEAEPVSVKLGESTAVYNALVWEWTAPRPGPVTFWAAESPFETVLGISSNNLNLAYIGYADGKATLDAMAGQTYKIAVAPKQSGADGEVLLYWFMRPSDKISNARKPINLEDLRARSGTWKGNLDGATDEKRSFDKAFLEKFPGSTNTVWLTWLAPPNITYTTASFKITGSSTDAVMAVFKGSSTILASAGRGEDAKFIARRNGLYRIGVAGKCTDYSIATGAFTVEWAVSPYVTIVWDANGGALREENEDGTYTDHSELSQSFVEGGGPDALPVPERHGYTFAGWFTEENGGQQVTLENPFPVENHDLMTDKGEYYRYTYYAHWTPGADNASVDGARWINTESGSDTSSLVNAPAQNDEWSCAMTNAFPDAGATKFVWWEWTAPTTCEVMFTSGGEGSVLGLFMYHNGGVIEVGERLADNQVAYIPDGNMTYVVAVGMKNNVETDVTLSWACSPYVRVLFDLNGGTYRNGKYSGVFATKKRHGLAMTSIPKPDARDDCTFKGWYTQPETGGSHLEVGSIPEYYTAEHRDRYGWYQESRTYYARWQEIPRADDFAGAVALVDDSLQWSWYSGTMTGLSNVGATIEDGEPLADCGNTVWLKWTPKANGTMTLRTNGSESTVSGGELDTVLGVYTGTEVTHLTEVALNDNYIDEIDIGHYCSRVAFDAVSNTTYYICVASGTLPAREVGTIALEWKFEETQTFDSNGGTFASGNTEESLTVTYNGLVIPSLELPAVSRPGYSFAGWFSAADGGEAFDGRAVAPGTWYAHWTAGIANDNYENAMEISLSKGTITQSNDGASAEEGEPLTNRIKGQAPSWPHSLWWKWTAPANGTVVFDTTGSLFYGLDENTGTYTNMPYETVMGIYTGENRTEVSFSGMNTDGEGHIIASSTNRFEATKGVTYFIGAAGRYDTQLNQNQQSSRIVLNWNYETLEGRVIEPLPGNATGDDIDSSLDGLNDSRRIKSLIGRSVSSYNDFADWVQNTIGNADAVAASPYAAESYLLGAQQLFTEEPEVQIDAIETGADGNGVTSMTLAVSVLDGANGDAIAVAAERVAALFEATTDLGDWESDDTRLEPNAQPVAGGTATTVMIRVTPGDGTSSRAFLRIKR